MLLALHSASTARSQEKRKVAWGKDLEKYTVRQEWKTPCCAGCRWQSSQSKLQHSSIDASAVIEGTFGRRTTSLEMWNR